MKKRDRDIELFNEMMTKYRFKEPVSTEVRDHVRRNKRKQFKKTLKKAGGSSIIFGIISYIFFTLRKFGIGITIVKSVILLTIAVLLAMGGLSSGIYFLLTGTPEQTETSDLSGGPSHKTIMQEKSPLQPSGLIGKKESTTGLQKQVKESKAVIEDRIGVKPFTTINMPALKGNHAASIIAEKLSIKRGRNRVLNLLRGRHGKKSGMLLFGSVESAGGLYTVTARVVRVSDAKILFYDSEIASSPADIDAACTKLADKIFHNIR